MAKSLHFRQIPSPAASMPMANQLTKLRCVPSSGSLSWLSQQTKSLADPAKMKKTCLMAEAVYTHFSSKALSPITSTFSCMDFKGQRAIIGTPGGDFGEFMLAYNVYQDIEKQKGFSYDTVKANLASFIDKHCSPARPFYKHTDAARVESLAAQMRVANFPNTRPADTSAWFKALVDPEMQGCGHLRSILHSTPSYNIQNKLAENLVCAFYDLYWDPLYQEKMVLEILPHPKDLTLESGLVIHDHVCPESPELDLAFTPYQDDCGLFSLNPNSQRVYRDQLTIPFFMSMLTDKSIPKKTFQDLVTDRGFLYWKNTGGYLNIVHIPLIELKDDGYIM